RNVIAVYEVETFVIGNVAPNERAEVMAEAEYPKPFCVALSHTNVFAVQFHPEKSQSNGLQLYENFLTWNGQA
ncbi:MAG: hypothetical protein SV422_13135, partial [Pseudomonadota bacterium]|nr:hypothetical protein [Pseudomonadota bacterium]